jgi:capsular polysaccharide transport system permease protein
MGAAIGVGMDVEGKVTVESPLAGARDLAGPVTLKPVFAPLTMFRRIVGRGLALRTSVEGSQDGLAGDLPRKRVSFYFLSFIGCVVIPAFACAIYFAFLASDQFVAETRFAVREANSESLGDKLKSALSSVSATVSTPVMSGQDAYIIADYIRSRAIIDDLSKEMDLRAIFRRPEADFWARLKDGASAEDLQKYWQGMVTVYVDAPSGVVTVFVRAFRPADALALSKAILTASEALANSVSERMRSDAMKRAETEVRRSEAKVVTALADLRAFRDKEGLIDPRTSATSTATLLTTVMGQKIKMQNDLFVATRAMSADAPTVKALKDRIEGLDNQIDDLKAKLTSNGSGASALSGVLSGFEEVELQRMFAEKLYEMSQDGLERARQKAEAQNIYVSVFVPPGMPEEAKYPERLEFSLLAPVGLSILWGILALVGSAVNDHRY